MEKRIALGSILGTIGGFINFLYALMTGYSLVSSLSDPESDILLSGSIVIAVILIILPVANFIGACTCNSKLAVGKALMYVTGLILLILFIDSLSNLLSSATEMYTTGIPAFLIIFYAVMIAAQGLSVAAAALLSIPAGKEQAPEYGGIFGIYQQDMPEKPQDEFQAVHRLYGLPTVDMKADTCKETNNESADAE